ncbi:MAG TPA: radical SAM/SPASM domain-containing protein [Burkholderiaceae bacterium]|jgi:MoaA/NifB/PqqE/SkfB family radical SAM enzyme
MDCSSAEAPLIWHARHARSKAAGTALQSLPLLTLYLTERCNSRCVSCDYWRHGQRDMSLETLERTLPDLAALGTRVILVSGGEPLLNPQWAEMASLLRANGLRLWLLTAGLALAKHARRVGELFESITVSLDGACRETYLAIRGLDAFEVVCEGIRATVREGVPVGLRVTIQRSNCRELSRLVSLAHELGASSISFLAADVGNSNAFGRQADEGAADIALRAEDLPAFADSLARLEREHAEHFRSGFIQESPAKLRRLYDYFRAVCGLGGFPAVRCNAPEFSAVLETDGSVRPCFFIPGPPSSMSGLEQSLNAPAMQSLRADIRAQQRAECARCVCSKWRDPQAPGALA